MDNMPAIIHQFNFKPARHSQHCAGSRVNLILKLVKMMLWEGLFRKDINSQPESNIRNGIKLKQIR